MRRVSFLVVSLILFLHSIGQTVATNPTLQRISRKPNITLPQFLDSMGVFSAPNDTGEGGEESKLGLFKQYWNARVSKTDSSGASMFEKYAYALRAVTN